MTRCSSSRSLLPLASLALLLALAGCGEDCDTCPTCPGEGYRTFVIRPDGTGDRAGIQAAIDDAQRGDVIMLEDGVYRGPGNYDLEVGEKGLVILSRSGNPAACYIDCGDAGEEGVRVLRMAGNGEGLWMDGIGFRNARSSTGGAIYVRRSLLRLINCAFIGNEAVTGGGIAAVDSDVLLESCLFESNSGDTGAGVWVQGGEFRLRDCSFKDNEAGAGGGGIGSSGADLSIRDCLFADNTVSGSGGAIHVTLGSLRISGSRFTGNSAGQYGGAVFVEDAGSAIVLESFFSANQALSGSATYSACSLVLNHCTIVANVVRDQGTLRQASGLLIAESCTIADNVGPSEGGTVALSGDSQAILDRCILAYNRDGLAARCFGDAQIHLNCCNVYGHSQGDYEDCLAGQNGHRGNISEDPLFCDYSDYRLQEGSPSADAPCGRMGSRAVGCR